MQKQLFEKSPKRTRFRAGFTLVEILVVLAIISILAAFLFPAFNRMRETGYQATCASNLKQIAVAVRQYYQDERFYPSSITYLMPRDVDLTGDGNPDTDGTPPSENNGAAAYISTLDTARCPDDDIEPATPTARLSYGAFGTQPASLPALAGTFPSYTSAPPTDPGLYVWNYWGYRPDGYAYQTAQEAAAANPNTGAAPPNPPYPYLVNKQQPYYHRILGPLTPQPPTNVVEQSLSNRFAPKDTIITHCVFHRLPTASNLNNPSELYYNADPTAGSNARDIVLLLSGEARTLDVSSWADQNPADPRNPKWQTQQF